MERKWLILMVILVMAALAGSRVESAQPNWQQFCDKPNVGSKTELLRVVGEWKNCNLPREMFFARLSGQAGTNIRNLEDFRTYVESRDREMVACDWRKGDVEIDHIVKGKQIDFGRSWRPCRAGEYVLIDMARPTGSSGRIVLSGWCLNTVNDRRPPMPPPPPPPPRSPIMPPEKTSPWLPPSLPETPKVTKVPEEKNIIQGCSQVTSPVEVPDSPSVILPWVPSVIRQGAVLGDMSGCFGLR